MIVPQEGPSTVWIQQLDDNGQPIPGQRIRTTAHTIRFTPDPAVQAAETAVYSVQRLAAAFSMEFTFAAEAFRQLAVALGFPAVRTPLERHLSTRMSRVRRARQRR